MTKTARNSKTVAKTENKVISNAVESPPENTKKAYKRVTVSTFHTSFPKLKLKPLNPLNDDLYALILGTHEMDEDLAYTTHYDFLL